MQLITAQLGRIGQLKTEERVKRNESRRGQHPTRRQKKLDQAKTKAADTARESEEPEAKKAKGGGADSGRERPTAALSQGLAIGLNQVTRALDQKRATLVFYCRSLKPAILVQHLPILCHQQHVPLAGIYELSSKMRSVLGCKTVAAFAFVKKEDGCQYQTLVDRLLPLVPPLSLPWLETAQHRQLAVCQVMAVPKAQQRKPSTVESKLKS